MWWNTHISKRVDTSNGQLSKLLLRPAIIQALTIIMMLPHSEIDSRPGINYLKYIWCTWLIKQTNKQPNKKKTEKKTKKKKKKKKEKKRKEKNINNKTNKISVYLFLIKYCLQLACCINTAYKII